MQLLTQWLTGCSDICQVPSNHSLHLYCCFRWAASIPRKSVQIHRKDRLVEMTNWASMAPRSATSRLTMPGEPYCYILWPYDIFQYSWRGLWSNTMENMLISLYFKFSGVISSGYRDVASMSVTHNTHVEFIPSLGIHPDTLMSPQCV